MTISLFSQAVLRKTYQQLSFRIRLPEQPFSRSCRTHRKTYREKLE